ncbi:LysR family transcriptional regulator [Acinetobacter baumannii]|uniref:LysR family transcriptional regulator n=1 Tax=Acinetobacter baumannii TaxID=470 RepID=UPI00123057AF|nr:LysR family transcriptional regulator [Acinetobacter baumannii]MDI9663092.1 LysR family transcriptional regulator [Acinetobacter baumannii]MDI9709147.1 LysR family transcriptional regulator [Acinetobacter baumannii]
MIDLKKIIYFQYVAQYGSISEAARHLFIVQPALSRQIQELENYLGVTLFIRQAKGIELTPAGKQFLKDASHILFSLDQARSNAQRVAGIAEVIHIGIAPTYTWNPAVTQLLSAFQLAYPNIQLIIEPTLAISQSERLSDGSLDAGFMAWRPKADKTKISIPIMKCHLIIACAQGSRIEAIAKQSLHALEQENCIFFPREQSPEFFDFTFIQCEKLNFKPQMTKTVSDFNSALGLVSVGLGYTIISSASRFNCPQNITLFEYPELDHTYDLEFVYRTPLKKENMVCLIDFIKNNSNYFE